MLQERRDAKGGFLSGGQRKMLGLAMAFVSRPRCLLLDEPSAGLAESVTESVFLMVERLAQSNMTLVVSEQDPRWLSEADKMYEATSGGWSTRRPRERRATAGKRLPPRAEAGPLGRRAGTAVASIDEYR